MIEQASLVIGNGNFAVKENNFLGYALNQGLYVPRALDVTRATTATLTNPSGIIEDAPYNLALYSEQFENAYWVKLASTVSANAIVAPNGTLTADKFLSSTVNTEHRIVKDFNIPLATETLSVYAKKGEYNFLGFRVSISGGFKQLNFNLANGTFTDYGGVGGYSNITMTDVGNGWYRCSASFLRTNTLTQIHVLESDLFNPSYIGSDTSGIYIWGYQLVIGSVAKEYFPTTDRVDVPRVDYSSGSANILVEPQRTNLALYSEQLDNVYWVKTNSTVTANQVNSPSGALTADRLVDTATTGEHNIEKQITITAGTNTFSIFAKKDNNRYFEIGVVNAINSGARFIFDFDTKTITSFGAIGATVTYVGSSVVELADGWFRLSLTYTSSTTTPFFVAGLSNSPNVGTTNLVSYTGDGTKGVYIWGAQVETGVNATSYIPTTTATVTRNQDIISKTGADNLIGQSEGTVLIDFYYENNFTELFNIQNSTTSFLMRTRIGQVGSNVLSTIYANSGSFPLHPNYTLTPNSLNKICIVYNYANKTTKLFANGVFVGSTVGVNPYPTTSQNRIGLGNFAGDGTLARFNNILLYKTQLTDAECIALTTL